MVYSNRYTMPACTTGSYRNYYIHCKAAHNCFPSSDTSHHQTATAAGTAGIPYYSVQGQALCGSVQSLSRCFPFPDSPRICNTTSDRNAQKTEYHLTRCVLLHNYDSADNCALPAFSVTLPVPVNDMCYCHNNRFR